MIFILLVSFRVTSPSQKKIILQEKLVKSQAQKEKCVDKSGVTYQGGSYDNDEYFFCDATWSSKTMKFYNCIFHDISMVKSPNSMLLHSKYANFKIEYCEFKNINYKDKMIYLDSRSTVEFVFNNNYISNCNSGNNEARIVYTDNNNNDIKNNYIYFDPSISVGQAFYLEYLDNNRFKNNTVINAKCDHGCGIYSVKNDKKGDFQLKDCTFTNCRGTDGSIIHIDKLKNSLTIENTKFENVQNYYQNNGDLIHIIGRGEGLKLSFVNCFFRYLETDSRVGGGIGLYFYTDNDKTIKKKVATTITFENTHFEHILHKHESVGGGAIAIDQGTDCYLNGIIINNCVFKNVSDTNNGGAIFYNTNENTISIRRSTFEQTSSSKDGNSIYIGQSNSYTVTIANTHFLDCGTQPNSYVININSDNFDFFDNEIIFSDQSKSCGCIKSNKYSEHNYLRNIFRNAHVNFAKNSAGIDESNSANSNKIHITDNIFDGISGQSEGRCFYVKFAKTDISLNNNTIQNCPSGGVLIKIELETKLDSLQFYQYKFIKNSINDVPFNEYQISPQIFVRNAMNGDFPNEIELVFNDCIFQENQNAKKGGAISYGKNHYNALTRLKFDNCEFHDNSAKEGGSALSFIVYQGCTINNCHFIRNECVQGSGVIYIETDFECSTNSGKPTSSPQISIDGCLFKDNVGKDAGIAISSSQNAPVSIKNTPFTDCGNSGHVIAIQSNVQSTIIEGCFISYTGSVYSGGISIHSNGKIDILFINFISTSVDSALSIESEESAEKISVTQCLFDSCTGKSYSCFYISAKTNSFEFKDITVKNVKISGCDNYLGSFKMNGQIVLTLTNVSFNGISCSSLYGGGTGMTFSGILELTFDKCDFISNEAHQDVSKSRPLANSDVIPYYNGDGGAIQIGCQAETAQMSLKFDNCNFRDNKAFRHGGALAIQTIKKLDLYNCKIEKNIANYDFDSSSSSGNLLYENYYHLKKDGRGGAIYLNPASGCVDSYTENVIINDCEISWNNAYDGYAIYIEGDDPGTEFTIIKNNFNDNYNKSNHEIDNPNQIYGAVITTEICRLTMDDLRPSDQLENTNYFAISDRNLQLNELSCVDHSGRTKTKEFTESDYFPTESFTSSNVFSFSAHFSNSNGFSVSNPFSPSDHFPSSSYFTASIQFTKSSHFSNTDSFSKSNHFTLSNSFSNSDYFSQSNQFSGSNKFTNSDSFTKTGGFSKTDSFTGSDHFSESNKFSNSAYFTHSRPFSGSNKFTNSDSFTKTGGFSKTDSFTGSDHFSESNKFSNSAYFTHSNQFSGSNKFTNSDSFTKTGGFSRSSLFSESGHFSESSPFSNSAHFTQSNQFSNSNKFTHSDSFSKSDEFSRSSLFSESGHFSESNKFSNSAHFTQSNQFSNSNKFTNSDSFSKSGEFSRSSLFSDSGHFSESSSFSNSNLFTLSDMFSRSDQFTGSMQFSKTGSFTETNLFSHSDHFSQSTQFTKSEDFTSSSQFSNSNQFSKSDDFTKTNKFSETRGFSESSLFSKSSSFSLSDAFSPSLAFSGSNKFSQTEHFSTSEKFSSSTKFTLSKSFSESEGFSASKSFSLSKSFSKSVQFSNSNKFTETQAFSVTDKFTFSSDFTISQSFSDSKEFTNSLGFSKSLEFSSTNKFSYSSKFSTSHSFTLSDKFTDSSAFSQSDNFKPSTVFTNSNEFSKTGKFSYSNKFSNSGKFSESGSFSLSEKFTNSNKFTSSNNFSPTSSFSHSKEFSKSNPFSKSHEFSYSNQFSPSLDFSPSITPELSEPLCGLWEDGVYTIYNNCDFVINDKKLVYIYVLASNFSEYRKEEQNGGAIHLINCGIHCNDTNFIDCVSLYGAGGGVYINSTFDMTNNATFENVLFLRCKASYGGAVFIYSDSDLFNISFDSCHFESNEAFIKKKPTNGQNKNLYGGSAMYIMSKKFTISNSSFVFNKGSGSMKIFNNFDEEHKSSLLQKNENSIYILSCKFDEDENSKGSINYIDEKSGINLDIVDCKFKGNIKKGSHFINGKLYDKENIHVKSCNFENDLNNSVIIKLIDKDLPILVDNKIKIHNVRFMIALIAVFTLIVLVINANYHSNNYRNKSQDSLVIVDDLYDNSFRINEKSSL